VFATVRGRIGQGPRADSCARSRVLSSESRASAQLEFANLEWKGTEVVFEVSKGDKTEVRFTHLGLVPEYECFNVCSNAWGSYINGSLRSLITTGKGHPNQKGK
jgi:hypothetical protein